MLGRLNDLDRRMITHLDTRVGWEGHLWEAPSARVGFVGGADELDAVHHDIRHVGRDGAEAHVDVDEGRGVAGEPAGLEGEGAAGYGPFGAVGRGGHATAWGHVLEKAWEGGGVGGNYMGRSTPCRMGSMDRYRWVRSLVVGHLLFRRCRWIAGCCLASRGML